MAGTDAPGTDSTPAARPNPYVGPRPFEQGETLYGRDREIAELYYFLSAERVVLFHSPSGAGKTSLIQAGLVPRLRSHFDVWHPTRLNQEPVIQEIGGRPINRYVLSAVQGLEAGVPAELQRPVEAFAGQSLTEYVAERPRNPSAPVSLVLIFDQFEEILTVDPLARDGKREFFHQLGGLLHDPEIWALFVLREEYLAALDPYAQQVPTHLKNRFRIDLLGLESAQRAITRPAEAAGREFTEPAIEQLLHDLATVKVQQADDSFVEETGHHVEPMQLQVVCRRLWEQLPDHPGSIDSEHLTRFGDVTEALAAYYASSVARITGGQSVQERAIREWFGERLISESGIRVQVVRGMESSGGLGNEIVQRLLDAHLIRAEQRAGATWYELAHDRLLEPVRKDNAAWRQAHLSQAQLRAALWERQDRLPGLLFGDEELAEAERWAADHASELTDVELRFFAACREAQAITDRERKQTRRIRRLAIVSTIVSVVAVIAGIIAGVQWLRAADQKQQTEKEKRKAKNLAHAAIASKLLADRESSLSALVALEIREPADTSTAVATLHEALTVPVEIMALTGHTGLQGNKGYIFAAPFSPDGTQIVTASGDTTARIWNVQTGEKIATLKGHEDSVRVASFSPDGSRVLTASLDETARVWNAQTGEEIATLRGHSDADAVPIASFSPDGSRIVTAGLNDRTVRIWGANTSGDIVSLHILKRARVFAASFSRGGVWAAMASSDHLAVEIWDVQSGKKISTLRGHTGFVFRAFFSQDGSKVVTAADDTTARIWDAQTGEEIATLKGHTATVFSPSFSPNGHKVVTASKDKTVRIWHAQTGGVIAILRTAGSISVPFFNADGTRVVTFAQENPMVRIWDAQTGEEIATLKGYGAHVTATSFSPDGSRLVTGSADGTARIWHVQTGEEISKLEGRPVEVLAASLGRAGAEPVPADALAASFVPRASERFHGAIGPEYLRIRNAQTGKEIATLGGDNQKEDTSGRVLAALFSTDGARVVATYRDRQVDRQQWHSTARIWDAQNGQEIAVLEGHTSGVSVASFSPDGTQVITASGDGSARIWDAQTGQEVAILEGHASWVKLASFSPDGDQVVTVSGDRVTRVWNSQTGKEIATLKGHAHVTFDIASFSPDGSQIVTVPRRSPPGANPFPYAAHIWDAQTGDEIALLFGHTGHIRDASFSEDGSRAVTASDDRTGRIWNTQTGEQIATLQGHGNSVLVASFSPDGSRVVTASRDGTARIWDAQTGLELATLKGHTDWLSSATFSADGARVVTASLDGTLRSWANPQDYPTYLQSRIRAKTRLCLDASFRQSNLGELTAEAERNAQACERCVPVFFERLSDAPLWEWQIYEQAWRVYRECLDRER